MKQKSFTPLEVNESERKHKANKPLTGFTLIELLVVIAVFSIIIVVILGIFTSTVKAQKYSLASQQLIDQTSYTMEYMSRMIRMARKDTIGCTGIPDSNFGGDGTKTELQFVNYKNKCVKFYLSGGQIYRDLDQMNSSPITSDKFTVKKLKFDVAGDSVGDNIQPRVVVVLEMEANEAIPKPNMKIQTTVSQRNLDLNY